MMNRWRLSRSLIQTALLTLCGACDQCRSMVQCGGFTLFGARDKVSIC
jgi:hypothetical protein